MASSFDGQLVPQPAIGVGTVVDSRGKHRILAELKRLEQELRYLQVLCSPLFSHVHLFAVCFEHFL